jgi:hypothetical protein
MLYRPALPACLVLPLPNAWAWALAACIATARLIAVPRKLIRPAFDIALHGLSACIELILIRRIVPFDIGVDDCFRQPYIRGGGLRIAGLGLAIKVCSRRIGAESTTKCGAARIRSRIRPACTRCLRAVSYRDQPPTVADGGLDPLARDRRVSMGKVGVRCEI